jgi:aspartate aminotransferase
LTFQNNQQILVQELKSFNGVKLIPPKGTFYALPDFRAYLPSNLAKDSVELSKLILQKALVVTVPGSEFGMEGHLRLSYVGSVKEIKEGIERIKWVLDPTSPNEIYIGDRKLVRDWL